MQNYLSRHPLFVKMNREIINKYCSTRSIYSRQYRKGFTLHNEGESCETLDIIESGMLLAYSLNTNGNSLVMFSFHSDDIIGANLLFAKNNTYPLNIYCETNCRIINISRDAVKSLLSHQSFVFTYIQYLSDITQNVNRKIFIVSGKSLRERITEYLKNESIKQNSNRFSLPVTKKQMADILGVRRPSLFRELKNMRKEGLLDYNNRSINLYY